MTVNELIAKHFSTLEALVDVLQKAQVPHSEGEALLGWMIVTSLASRNGKVEDLQPVIEIMATAFTQRRG